MPFNSIAFLFNICIPSHTASEDVAVLSGAEAKAFGSRQPQNCRLCQREFAIDQVEESYPWPNLYTDGNRLTNSQSS